MIESLNKRGITIRIDYDTVPVVYGFHIAGYALNSEREIVLFRRHAANSNPTGLVSTLLHIGLHIRHATTKQGKLRKDFYYSKAEESRVRILEEYLASGVRPSLERILEIRMEVKILYKYLKEK